MLFQFNSADEIWKRDIHVKLPGIELTLAGSTSDRLVGNLSHFYGIKCRVLRCLATPCDLQQRNPNRKLGLTVSNALWH